jgi:hypothetical protein
MCNLGLVFVRPVMWFLLCAAGIVFVQLDLYFQVWACTCSSGLVFASRGLDLQIWLCIILYLFARLDLYFHLYFHV